MKLKKFVILFPLILSLSSCSKKQNILLNETLKQTYDFYEYSVTKIIDTMNVSIEQADDIFNILIDIGLDEKILSITKRNSNYNMFISNKYITLYLQDGKIQKITDVMDNIIYPISNTEIVEDTEQIEEGTPQIINIEKEPLQIIEHHFDQVDVYGNTEIQLIVSFNRTILKEELGDLMFPTYTYKYYISTYSGDDFIVDYNNGNTLSYICFNEDFTEYKIADSGNGMREGRYKSNPFFTPDNIKSIKIVLYKKVNDEEYNHDYEIISEYNYSTNEETSETIS